MYRKLFISNKSLFFQIKRFIYDDLRYKKIYFIHRKTFLNNLFIYNNSYFYIIWRFFYIQEKNQYNITHDQDEQIMKTESFKIYNQFISNFLSMNYMKKNLSNKNRNMFFNNSGNVSLVNNLTNIDRLTELLLLSKQNITELFYIIPLNLDNSITIKQYQSLFMDKSNMIDSLLDIYRTASKKELNYNLFDIGMVSKIADQSVKKDELVSFIELNTNKVLDVQDGVYKMIIWNILNNGIKQNNQFLMNSI